MTKAIAGRKKSVAGKLPAVYVQVVSSAQRSVEAEFAQGPQKNYVTYAFIVALSIRYKAKKQIVFVVIYGAAARKPSSYLYVVAGYRALVELTEGVLITAYDDGILVDPKKYGQIVSGTLRQVFLYG
jgi:hypothetical protein